MMNKSLFAFMIIFGILAVESHVILVMPEQGWILRLPSSTETEVVDLDENRPALQEQNA